MKDIFLDTDIGGDCDDAGALSLLCHLQQEGACRILAVTGTTSRHGASGCIRAVADSCGVAFPIGKIGEIFMGEEDGNVYAKCFSDDGVNEENSVHLFRRIAATAERKFTLAAIGPLRNVARFLTSEPDDISPMNGMELFREKVDRLCVMGGCFVKGYCCGALTDVEYNIMQDVEAAKIVSESCPSEIVYSPFELGNNLITGQNLLESNVPAGVCYRKFNERWGSTGGRQSWDPVTCYWAVFPETPLIAKSEAGKIFFTDEGVSVWERAAEGKHCYLTANAEFSALEAELNRYIK